MILTLAICIIIPLMTDEFNDLSKSYIIISISLIIFHPLNVMGHYNLLDHLFRWRISIKPDNKYGVNYNKLQYFPVQEKLSVCVSVIVASVIGIMIYVLG